mgnify:CR=1 FL=1
MAVMMIARQQQQQQQQQHAVWLDITSSPSVGKRYPRLLLPAGLKSHNPLRPKYCCVSHHVFPHSSFQVKETTRAVTFLHNELFFAAAQKKYVYIYDMLTVGLTALTLSATRVLPVYHALSTLTLLSRSRRPPAR